QPLAPGRPARRPRGARGDAAIEGRLRVHLLRACDRSRRLLRRARARRGDVLPGGLRAERQLAVRGDAVTTAQSWAHPVDLLVRAWERAHLDRTDSFEHHPRAFGPP